MRRHRLIAAAAAVAIAATAAVIVLVVVGGHGHVPTLADLMQVRMVDHGSRTVNTGHCRPSDDWAARTASCPFKLIKISRDPLHNSNSQHEAAVEPSLARAGQSMVVAYQVARAEEGAAAAAIGFATTHDGGRSWQSGFLPRLTVWSRPGARFRSVTDPVVAYDAAHHIWLVASYVFGADARPTAALVVTRSHDGINWSPPVRVVTAGLIPFFDKPWITCDNSRQSPYRGRCYFAYSSARGVVIQRSDDGGRSWSKPAGAAASDIIGALPVVAPDGLIELFFRRGERVFVTRSSDGGLSFDTTTQIASVRLAALEQAGRDAYNLRAPTLPSAGVDGSGTTYVVWTDCAGRRGCHATDVLLSTSRDAAHWTRPRRIVRAPRGTFAVLASVAADGTSGTAGRLALVYYLFARGTLVPRLAVSADGGATWATARQVSPATLQVRWLAVVGAPPTPFIGDYMAVSVDTGHVAVALTLAAPPAGRRLRQVISVLRTS